VEVDCDEASNEESGEGLVAFLGSETSGLAHLLLMGERVEGVGSQDFECCVGIDIGLDDVPVVEAVEEACGFVSSAEVVDEAGDLAFGFPSGRRPSEEEGVSELEAFGWVAFVDGLECDEPDAPDAFGQLVLVETGTSSEAAWAFLTRRIMTRCARPIFNASKACFKALKQSDIPR